MNDMWGHYDDRAARAPSYDTPADNDVPEARFGEYVTNLTTAIAESRIWVERTAAALDRADVDHTAELEGLTTLQAELDAVLEARMTHAADAART